MKQDKKQCRKGHFDSKVGKGWEVNSPQWEVQRVLDILFPASTSTSRNHSDGTCSARITDAGQVRAVWGFPPEVSSTFQRN